MDVERAIQNYAGQPITQQILLNLLKEYKRPFDKISEMVRQEVLIPLKRGLFITGPVLGIATPEPYLLANHLWGPGYISLETALGYWQFIPERVYEIASMTTGRTKTYETAVGRFSYTHLPLPYFSFGQLSVKLSEDQYALMATPEKAICDKIITTAGLLFRSTIQLKEWLLEDMRIEKEQLGSLKAATIKTWLDNCPKRESIQLLVKILEEL